MLFPWLNSLFNLVYMSIMKFQACLTGRALKAATKYQGGTQKKKGYVFLCLRSS